MLTRLERLRGYLNVERQERLVDFAIILLLAFFAIALWFQGGRLLAREESGLFFSSPERWTYSSSYAWWDVEATGFQNVQVLVFMPYQYFMSLLKGLGFNDVFLQASTLFFLLLTSGISMYSLTRYLIRDGRQRSASLAAAIIYMFNPYSLYIWTRFNSAIFFIPFFPLIILLYLIGTRSEKHLVRKSLTLGLAFFLPLPAFVNPTYLAPFLVVLLGIFCFQLLEHRKDKVRFFNIIRFTVAATFFSVLINLWWLLPLSQNITGIYQTSTNLLNPLAVLLDVSHLYYQPAIIFTGFEGYNYNRFVYSSILTFIAIGLPILAFTALLFERKRTTVLFSILAVFGIVLCLGSGPPFGDILVWFFNAIPLTGGFRAPYDKFGVLVAISYSFLGGFTIGSVFRRIVGDSNPRMAGSQLRKSLRRAICPLVILIVVIPSAYPFFTVKMYEPYEIGGPIKGRGAMIEIPDEYRQANEWLANQSGDFRVISLPLVHGDAMAYNWSHGYGGIDPWPLWNNPQIVGTTWNPYIDAITNLAESSLLQTDQYWKAMAILGSKYSMVHEDMITSPRPVEDYSRSLEKADTLDFDNALLLVGNISSWVGSGVLEENISHAVDISPSGRPSSRIESFTDKIENWEGGVTYPFVGSMNLSAYRYLSFYVKFDSLEFIHRAYVRLSDNKGGWEIWEFTNSISQYWTKVIIDLSSSPIWNSVNGLDISRLMEVQVTVEKVYGPMHPIIWWLSDLRAVPVEVRNQTHISKSEVFGDLHLYKLDDNFSIPLIYATNEYLVTNDMPSMGEDLKYIDPRKELLIVENQQNEANLTSSKYFAATTFGDLDGFGVSTGGISALIYSPPLWIDDSFVNGWEPYDAQGASIRWSTDGNIATLGMDSPDTGNHLVSMKRTDIRVNIEESPYITIKAKTDPGASIYFGFRIEDASGMVHDLLGGGKSPIYATQDTSDGWLISTANVHEWATSLGIQNPKYITGISYYVYNNGNQGILNSHIDYISFGKLGTSSPATTGRASTVINVPKSGDYSVAVKVMVGKDCGSLILRIDDKQFVVDTHSDNEEPSWEYRILSPVHMENGSHELSVLAEDTVAFESVAIYSFNEYTSRLTSLGQIERAIHSEYEATTAFRSLEGFGTLPSGIPALSYSPSIWVDDSFVNGWEPYDAQGASIRWSTDGNIATLGMDSPDTGNHLVSMKRTDIRVNIEESPYITIKAKKDPGASIYYGFRIENESGAVWDLMGSGITPRYSISENGDGWVIGTADMYNWSKSLGIHNPTNITGISYYVYNNGNQGILNSYTDYISFGKLGTSSPKKGIASMDFDVPESRNYSITFRVITGNDYGNFTSRIDNREFVVDTHSENVTPSLGYRTIPSVYLDKGSHSLSVIASESVAVERLFINWTETAFKESVNPMPKISFQKIDPVRYRVTVENCTNPFFLVFSSTFDRGWTAYYGEPDFIRTFSGNRVPEENHFIANGYANAWYVDSKTNGSFVMTLYFTPQNLVVSGEIVSGVTVGLSVLYLLGSVVTWSPNSVWAAIGRLRRHKK